MASRVRIVGLNKRTDEWKKMKAVWDACSHADIEVPDEVKSFFDYEAPIDTDGFEVSIPSRLGHCHYSNGALHEIDLDELPAEVRIIRVYETW